MIYEFLWKLRAVFIRAGLKGWRVTTSGLPGNPDFVFTRKKLAVFVDGCFWHGCPKCYRRPTSNRKYWDGKVARNKSHDKIVNHNLRKLGWSVVRIWECALRKKPSYYVRRIFRFLNSKSKAAVPMR
jgi:DNA mismatch endonuclease, patch repair protein